MLSEAIRRATDERTGVQNTAMTNAVGALNPCNQFSASMFQHMDTADFMCFHLTLQRRNPWD
jgi:hypothetical protein